MEIALDQASTISIPRPAWAALAASWVGWMFDGYEVYALVLVMSVAVRQLVPPAQLQNVTIYAAGLLSATLLGWAIGGIIAGVLTDYVGRRRMLMISILWYAVFAGFTAFATSYWWLLSFRFLTGFGLGAEWGPGSAIVAEFWPPSSRGRAGGMLHSAHGVGYFLASAIWLIVAPLSPTSWRYMFLVGVAPAFLLLIFRRVVHDPMQWVIANDRRREAQQRIENGRAQDTDRELTQFTLAQVLSNAQLRRRIGLLLLMAISTAIGSWCVSTWIPEHAAQRASSMSQPQRLASAAALAFSIGAIAGYLAFGWLADRLGRKRSLWLYYVGAAASSLIFFLHAGEWHFVVAMAAANGFFVNGQFAWMTIYLPEVFPTRVRGSAMSLVFDGSRSISAVGPLLAGRLATSLGGIGRAAAVMSFIYIVGLAATPFAAPETKGTILRD